VRRGVVCLAALVKHRLGRGDSATSPLGALLSINNRNQNHLKRPSNHPPKLTNRFEDHFKAGEHYAPLSMDLSDLIPQSQALIAAFSSARRGELRAMARRAADAAASTFHVLSQLDSLAHTAQRVRAIAGAPLEAGAEDGRAGEGWRLLRLKRGVGAGEGWKSAFLGGKGMQDFRRRFVVDMADNLMAE